MSRSNAQRGSVLLVVLVILVALLAGGGVALYLQLANTRSTGLVKFSRASLFCAEAGLQAARPTIMNNYPTWAGVLNASYPPWYAALPGSITGLTQAPAGVTNGLYGEAGDGGTAEDWVVWITDNDDEFPTPDATADSDLKVFIHSRCLMYPDQPREIIELVHANAKGKDYENKGKGGQNANDQTAIP